MEEKTLEYYHLKIEQLLTSNEFLNQEKSDLQDEAEALQERIDEQIKLLTNILITLGITTTRAEGERLIQGGGVLKQVEKLKDRIDELEEDLETILKDIESGHFVAHDTVELIKKTLRRL